MPATAAHAQSVRGRVVEATSGGPIIGVQLRLLDEDGAVAEALSDSAGRFYMAAEGAGLYRLEATHIGFAPVETDTLRLAFREALEVVIRMSTEAIALDPLLIQARVVDVRHAATHDGFRKRHESAPSVGPTRLVDFNDPEFQNALSVPDILRYFVPDRGCRTLYWDGHLVLTPAMDSVRMETPTNTLLGVEFYKNYFDAPIEMRHQNPYFGSQVLMEEGTSDNCSVVAVWTRDGEKRAVEAEPPPQLPATRRMAAEVSFRAPEAGERPGTLKGTVYQRSGTEPAAAAVVELVGPNGERFGIARADETGAFVLVAPGPGRYVLRAVHDELGAGTSDPFELPAGQAATVTLRVGA
ncbi:MAG: carboxypeptidase-like regulatory domain-containing protein [Gemmatimonadota bacterium]